MAKAKIEENQLLTPEERVACEGFASADPPHSQRAMALLALDEGATQMQAAGQAGLTKGQVRYWLGKFRQERLTIFPEGLLASREPEPAPELRTAKVPEPPASSQEVSPPSQPVDPKPALLESPAPAGLLEAETEEKAEPAKGAKKAKKAQKGEKRPKKKAKKKDGKKAKKEKRDKNSQKKSKSSKKKKAKKKDKKKAKKGKAGNKKK